MTMITLVREEKDAGRMWARENEKRYGADPRSATDGHGGYFSHGRLANLSRLSEKETRPANQFYMIKLTTSMLIR